MKVFVFYPLSQSFFKRTCFQTVHQMSQLLQLMNGWKVKMLIPN